MDRGTQTEVLKTETKVKIKTEVLKLWVQVSQLAEQVAALNMQQKEDDAKHYFYCNRSGHIPNEIVQTNIRSGDASHMWKTRLHLAQ